VEMTLPGGGNGRLEVLDLRGRVVARPWSGLLDAGVPLAVSWDGVDTLGQALPSGVYTFRLVGSRGQAASVRGVLVR
jgi:flagellar hook assembly protein FlgD